VSLIDLPLWNKAGWLATVYAAFPSGPPVLALGFRDREQGMLIFRAWRERLGAIDKKEELRISILRGIDKANPAAYRVVVSSQAPAGPGKMFVMTSRINTMQPQSTRRLDRFLSDFAGAGRYMLAPAEIEDETATPKIVMDLWIGKTKLEVRQMWEIGDNDPDLMSVRSDDDPIIPEGMSDAPIHGALERVRKWKDRSNH
jgi:hypothetical protein